MTIKVVCLMQKKVLTQICEWFLFAIFNVLFAANVSAVVADPVSLRWNPSSDTSVKGYVVYYVATNQPATNRIVVGTNLTVKLTNLQAGVTYKIYASSYNAAGIESPPSNQVQFTAQLSPKLKLTRQANGSMKLDYKATAGMVCGVQFSADMKPGSWRTLANVTADQVGALIATDASAASVPQRFYRIAHSPQPLVSAISITQKPNLRLELKFTTPPFAQCNIEYVTKPTSTNWRLLAHVTADAEGNVTFTDPNATALDGRFYRAVLQ